MKSFQEMGRFKIGLAGIALVVVVCLGLLALISFPTLTGGTEYSAAFANAGGLQSGDAVRMNGVQVGKVGSVDLDGNSVHVSFVLDGGSPQLGDASSAAIKTETALGRKFLQLTPAGSKKLDPSVTIPVARTSTPYDITGQLGQLTTTFGQIDTAQLAQALDAVASTFKDAPPEMRNALTGLGRISDTISSRDGEIRDLLSHANDVSAILANRNQQLVRLVVDGNSLMQELQQRQQAIHTLFVNVQTAAEQVKGLVQDNQAQLTPALQHFNSVLDILRKNEGSIAVALQQLGPFAGSVGEALGSGPFWDAYIANLLPGNLVPNLANPLQAVGGGK